MSRLWRQSRRINIDGTDYSDFDVDVSVVMPDDDPMSFDITLFNLADSTWQSIEKEDDVIVELGWGEGEVETVLYGEIDDRNVEYTGTDREYELSGEDKSSKAVKARYSDRFQNQSPDSIVQDIATRLGMTADTDSVGSPLSFVWSMTTERPVKYWLDELVDYAESLTDTTWEWHVEQGTLFFNETDSTFGEAPLLSYDTNLLSINEVDDSDSSAEKLEFEALLDPRITKGQEIVVDTDRFSGVYKVESYAFESSSVSGTHSVEATVRALDDVTIREPFEERVLQAQEQLLAPF